MNSLTIFAALYVLLLFGGYRLITNEEVIMKRCTKQEWIFFAAAIGFVTVIKLYLSQTFYGHSSDVSLFSAWADLGRNESVTEFYGELGKQYYVDYPPLYLYVLTFVGRLSELLRIPYGSDGYLVLIKLFPILSDTVTVLLVYRFAVREFSDRHAMLLSLFVLIHPAYILNSVFWGQIDGLYTLLIFWLIYSVYKKRYMQAVLAFAVGMLTKPQMLIFLPLLGFWLIYDVITELRETKKILSLLRALTGLLISVLLVIVCAYPIFKGDFGRFFALYTNATGQYPYASLNASNLFGAFGLNWANVETSFLGITYESWGFIGIIVTSVIVGLGTVLSHNRSGTLILGGFTVASIYMLAHMMHERYLFPLILILLITYIITKDKRMLFAFGVASILCFVQPGLVLLDNEGYITLTKSAFIALSWVHILFYIYLLAVWYQLLIHDDVKTPVMRSPKIFCIAQEERKVRYTRYDALIMLVLTVVYGITAFWNLGAKDVPQSGYYPQQNGETVILDLGEEYMIDRVNFYFGWIDRRDSDSEVERVLSVSFGNNAAQDGEKPELVFGEETKLVVNSVFRWDGFYIGQPGRYMKITVDEGNFYLLEAACFDAHRTLISPVGAYSDNPTATFLYDEQDKSVYEYTWYEGTYFDEVYHPRTAYEYLNGMHPYENTHPPLGKLIISLGMMLFGVNPFGWRFFGTLCGVVMVPMVYFLAKQLLKETKWAFVASFLFTFDFMHLSQTRLATIDSYTALFAMLMYYFMYQYITRNHYNTGVRKTLMPLFLSGLFFGIGVAVKWQGMYAGIGLAVLFFGANIKRFLEYRAAKDGRLVGDSETILRTFLPNTVKTMAVACVFFVVVPLLIYVVSYLPIVLSGSEDISYIWENQLSMFRYHSLLTETHPYGSSWWTWPLDIKPLYAYNPNRDFVPVGTAQGISTFGNPLVWWLTIPAMAYLIYLWAKKKANLEIYTVLAGFGALYFPWVLISRQAFIYHFFPCVAFVAIAAAYCMRELVQKKPNLRYGVWVYIAAVLVLYILYYPLLTGIAIPEAYARALTWFPTWVLG